MNDAQRALDEKEAYERAMGRVKIPGEYDRKGTANEAAASVERSHAVKYMEAAAKTVGGERGDDHGDIKPSFDMIARLWTEHLRAAMQLRFGFTIPNDVFTAADVALMMDMVKTARISWGRGNHADHYVDKIGYSGIAAMLNRAE